MAPVHFTGKQDHGAYRWGGVGMVTFLALAHMLDATQLVGWGGDGNVPCACTHVRCYAMVGWGGDGNVPCACTHVRCYAMVGWGGDGNVPCTCTHVRC